MEIILIIASFAYLTRNTISPMIWIGLAVFFFGIDTLLFLRGYDTSFWKHLTDNEKEYQRKKLGLK